MTLGFSFAKCPNDSAEIATEKSAIFLVALSCCLAGVLWSFLYFVVFGFVITSFLPLLFTVIVGISIVISHLTKNHLLTAYLQIVCMIYITSIIQWSIGGVFDSGFVMAWAFCGPIVALMYFSIKESVAWLTLYIANILVTVIFDDFFTLGGLEMTAATRTMFFALNLICSSIVVFMFAAYFVKSIITEREKSNRLLLNILPSKTARELKSKGTTVAERHLDVCILFADIVDFTTYSSKHSPEEVVSRLNDIFTLFDRQVEGHKLEKIKTIGDAYMVAGGLSDGNSDHSQRMAELALDMMSSIARYEREPGKPFSLRIGIHLGPVIAGVIGKSKFAYDLWGDTVNVASRMESTGVDGEIQVSEAFCHALRGQFVFDKRGRIDIKGKGTMDSYFLRGRIVVE